MDKSIEIGRASEWDKLDLQSAFLINDNLKSFAPRHHQVYAKVERSCLNEPRQRFERGQKNVFNLSNEISASVDWGERKYAARNFFGTQWRWV